MRLGDNANNGVYMKMVGNEIEGQMVACEQMLVSPRMWMGVRVRGITGHRGLMLVKMGRRGSEGAFLLFIKMEIQRCFTMFHSNFVGKLEKTKQILKRESSAASDQ